MYKIVKSGEFISELDNKQFETLSDAVDNALRVRGKYCNWSLYGHEVLIIYKTSDSMIVATVDCQTGDVVYPSWSRV